jgi:peptidoglycan/LPS O-acetylase OafA/YrhL
MTKQAHAEAIPSLTGLRGVAALWVAAYHAGGVLLTEVHLPAIALNLLQSGWLAVDLFFVLSGFIMCHVHLQDLTSASWPETTRFLKLRLARIYPGHAVAALCWLPALWATRHILDIADSGGLLSNFNGRTLLYSLTLTNGWGFPRSQGWNLPSWSVGSEWFAYLCFPLLAIFIARVKSTRDYLLTIGGVLLICVLLAFLINGGGQYMLPESWTTLRVVSEFVVGCCAYGIFLSIRRRPISRLLPWGGAIICLALAATPHPHIFDGVFILSFAALICGLASSPTALSEMLGTRLSIYLGKISYSVYLIHALIIVGLHKLLQLAGMAGRPYWFVAIGIYFVVVVAAGDLLWRLVEEPSRIWLRRNWIDRRAPGGI